MALVCDWYGAVRFETFLQLGAIEFSARQQQPLLTVRARENLGEILARIKPRFAAEIVELRQRHAREQLLINGRIANRVHICARNKHRVGRRERLERCIHLQRARLLRRTGCQAKTKYGRSQRTDQKSLLEKIHRAALNTTTPKRADVQIGM